MSVHVFRRGQSVYSIDINKKRTKLEKKGFTRDQVLDAVTFNQIQWNQTERLNVLFLWKGKGRLFDMPAFLKLPKFAPLEDVQIDYTKIHCVIGYRLPPQPKHILVADYAQIALNQNNKHIPRSAEELWDALRTPLLLAFETQKLCGAPLDVCWNKKPMKRVDYAMCRHLFAQGKTPPKDPPGDPIRYTGGNVCEAHEGLHSGVVSLDFEKFYPSIICAHNIHPVMTPLLRAIIKEERGADGARKKSLKQFRNCFYGALGCRYFRFVDERLAQQVTELGVGYQEQLIKAFGEPILGHTDNIIIKATKDLDLSVLNFPEGIKVSIEAVFDQIRVKNKTSYVGKRGDHYTIKGMPLCGPTFPPILRNYAKAYWKAWLDDPNAPLPPLKPSSDWRDYVFIKAETTGYAGSVVCDGNRVPAGPCTVDHSWYATFAQQRLKKEPSFGYRCCRLFPDCPDHEEDIIEALIDFADRGGKRGGAGAKGRFFLNLY